MEFGIELDKFIKKDFTQLKKDCKARGINIDHYTDEQCMEALKVFNQED